MVDARFANMLNNASLRDFTETVVVRLRLTPGDWVVWGRVVMRNYDGDSQNGIAHLRLIGGATFDTVQGRLIDEDCSECFSLQGAIKVPGSDHSVIGVEMVCASYKANASDGALMAIKVDSSFDAGIP